jgi:hypothetical protein
MALHNEENNYEKRLITRLPCHREEVKIVGGGRVERMVCVYNIQASSSKYGDERRGSHFLIHQSQVLFRSPPCTCVYLPTDCVVVSRQSLLWFPLLFRSTHLREATRLPRYTRLCTSSYYLIFKWKKNRIEGGEREKSTSFVCACVCVSCMLTSITLLLFFI